MTMTLPTPVHLMQIDPDTDARFRGEFGNTASLTPGSKGNGGLPITTNGSQMNNNSTSSATGTETGGWWEYLATGGYDVSSDTRVHVYTVQYNAPNRVQISDIANGGFVFRLSSSSASPPTTDYREWQIGGNDTVLATNRDQPRSIVIDLNDRSFDSETGTYDNTDVQAFAAGTVRLNISGNNSNLIFFQRLWVFETTKGASDIPTFTGTSDWDDWVDLIEGSDYTDKISNEWAQREGRVYAFSAPWQIGDNSTETDFNDNGAIVFWPDSNSPGDPKIRVSRQAFRGYLNLRNNAADTATFSGSYNAGNSHPDWDFDQDDAAVVTFNSPTFRNTGEFLVGSSITGSATWDGCGTVDYQDNGADLDGSTFRNPYANHLVHLLP